MIAIVPTAGLNLASISSALERLGAAYVITEDHAAIKAAERIILPGVGHAKAMMKKLRDKGLDALIQEISQPVLGICLGMQILFEHSEEGDADCLGIIPGRVVAIPASGLVLPHMGWNSVESDGSAGLAGAANAQYFYFVHSYVAEIGAWTTATTFYGSRVSAMVQWRNFYGTQFHPERSGAAGEALLGEFLCLT